MGYYCILDIGEEFFLGRPESWRVGGVVFYEHILVCFLGDSGFGLWFGCGFLGLPDDTLRGVGLSRCGLRIVEHFLGGDHYLIGVD